MYKQILIVILIIFCCSCSAYADDEIAFNSLYPGTTEFMLFTGIGQNHRYPSATKHTFNFDIIGFRLSSMTSPHVAVGLEMSTGVGTLENDNPPFWGTVCYQQYLRAQPNEAITLDVSVGLMKFRDNVPELATRTNFIEQIGVTYKWKKSENTAWCVQYKFSHMSNAGLRVPNIGINSSAITFGHIWYSR